MKIGHGEKATPIKPPERAVAGKTQDKAGRFVTRAARVSMLLTAILVSLLSLVLIGRSGPDAKAADDGWRPPMGPMHMESRADGNIYGVCYVRAHSEEQQSGIGENAVKFDIYLPDGQWVQGYCGNAFHGDADHGNHAQPWSDYYNFVAYKWHGDQPYGQTDYWIHVYSEWSPNYNYYGGPRACPPGFPSRQWVYGKIWYPKLLDVTIQKQPADPNLTVNPTSFAGATYTIRKDDNAGFDGNGTSVGAYLKIDSDGIGRLYRWDDESGATNERLWIAAGVNYVVFEVTTPTNGQWGKDPEHHPVNGQTDKTTLKSVQVTSTEPLLTVPSIGTTLRAGDAKTYSTTDASVTLTDTVNYANLVAGTRYVLQAKLHYRNGNADGGEVPGVTQTKAFTPTATGGGTIANGTESLDLTFSPSDIDTTKPLVCYEYLYYATDGDQPGNLVTSHENINDSGQTVAPAPVTPEIGTSLVTEEGGKTVQGGTGSVLLTDTVTYSKLTPNKQYRLECVIHGRQGTTDKGVIAGASATHSFTPTEASGSEQVPVWLNLANIGTGWDAVVAFEELYDGQTKVAEHKVITDTGQTVTVTEPPAPEIGTTLAAEGNLKSVARGTASVSLTDTVTYANLTPNKQYRLECAIHGRSESTDRGALAGATASKTFNASASGSGSVDVPVTLDMSKVTADMDAVVAFEELYDGQTKIAEHKVITDTGQTITVTTPPTPEIGTTLTAGGNAKSVTRGTASVSLTDTVTYANLTPNKQYRLECAIHGRSESTDRGALAGATASKTFNASASGTGSVDVPVTLDMSKVAEDMDAVVAFEELYDGQTKVAEHKVITDTGQTVTVTEPPEIATTLAMSDGDKVVKADATESVTLIDTVRYSGLTPGQEYRLDGVLHARQAGADKGAIEGSAGTLTFTPQEATGTVTVTLVLDMSKLPGDAVVAFERLYLGDELIATHEEIADEDQTVTVETSEKSMETTLVTANGQKSFVVTGSPIVLRDTVRYSGLIPGIEYELHGEVRAKDGMENGTVIAGSANTIRFTPEAESGTIVMELTVDPSQVKSWSLVAFERLYLDGELVTSHEDITDEDQTVTPTPSQPSISTRLSTSNGLKEIRLTAATQTITLVDEISYHGLTPGIEYEVRGELHERRNNADGGAVTGATGSVKFMPTATDGVVKVPIKVTVRNATKVLVAFERLYVPGSDEPVARHEDINDAEQSVTINAGDIASDILQTGAGRSMSLVVPLAAGSVISMVTSMALLVAARRRDRR